MCNLATFAVLDSNKDLAGYKGLTKNYVLVDMNKILTSDKIQFRIFTRFSGFPTAKNLDSFNFRCQLHAVHATQHLIKIYKLSSPLNRNDLQG